MKWISVKNKLPIYEGEYLIVYNTCCSQRIKVARWGKKSKTKYNWFASDLAVKYITHWHPIPKLPD